ncbi:hypothetical protein D3C87_80630 [compost metagenome]
MSNNEKWEEIENIDLSRRKAHDWARIYLIELMEEPTDDRLWSEYEWSYYVFNAKYRAKITDFKNYENELEKFGELEMRAFNIRRDLFLGASIGEKEILKDKYIETEWCRKKLGVF